MANERNSSENKKKAPNVRKMNSLNKTISGNINSLMDQIATLATGVPQNNDVEDLNSLFNSMLKEENDVFNRSGKDGTTSFISSLYSDSKDALGIQQDILGQLDNIFDNSINESSIKDFITENYKNRLLKQADLHEVATQLIELREAILITRDAIISSDVVEGKMTRNLKFDNTGDSTNDELIANVEALEDKFSLQDKIKNFIIPKTLEYGEYYAYIIPYSKIFGDFAKAKEKKKMGYGMYHETTLYDFVHMDKDNEQTFMESMNVVFESTYEKGQVLSASPIDTKNDNTNTKLQLNEYVDHIMKNITVSNDPVPLSVLEDGEESIDYFMENHIEPISFNEKYEPIYGNRDETYFDRVVKSDNGDGIYTTPYRKNDKNKDKDNEFKNIHDCYVKMIDPIHLLPIQIMSKRIGYYYIQSEDIDPLHMSSSTALYHNRFDDSRREHTLVDSIANEIIKSFDKKFLEKNIKFKELIVEALNYYNLNEQKVRFQFIPEEYIVAFKVSEDENGNGTSIIDPSLFYAKLYLMLLLFKMMSIILYSNDTRINYIRNSGIDKNVRKKVEEIARVRQQRTINVMDMFSYTSLVNKLGNGAEIYMPTGKSGERGMETEVIQGQEVQMNTDLMDNLKKAYILGTGVPDAIMNYMNEADFAKSLELANTRFQGRVVSYQFDFNAGITEMYKRIMYFAGNIPEDNIDTFEFSFAPPKASNAQIKSDMLQNFDSYATWALGLLIGTQNVDNPDNDAIVRKMKMQLAKDHLSMINFDHMMAMFKSAQIDGLEELLTPKGKEEINEDEELAGL